MSTEFKTKALNFFRENIEEYYSDVTDVTDVNLKSAEIAHYPKKLVSSYKKDYNIVEKLYDKCDAAFEDIEKNELTMSRVKKAQAAMDAFNTSIMILEESNAIFTAHNTHKTASQAAGLLILFALIVKSQQAQVKKLQADIPKLEKQLKSAKRDVTGAKAQRAINVAITGVTSVLPALKGAQLAYLVLGTAATRLAADAALGPTGPTTGAGVKTAAGEYAGAVDLVGKGSGKLMSAAGAIDALIADGAEIGKAEKTLKKVKKDLKDTQKRYETLKSNMASSDATFQAAMTKYVKATKAANDASAKFKAAKKKRVDLKKEL
ncbi:hypothetical protein OS190_02665 [Sulfitobacter sp. F26204]|uniref:hypothetical protein n=1 Tax=Sulfitobacter sp. F26204 TaxID=2996014 RepID=UPI00225E2476|nr:hypothetical protein [Sulfitobacter sp. F26204]MCX7558453.1 hypothetical protein [Sulfitobacter sp. F26204]